MLKRRIFIQTLSLLRRMKMRSSFDRNNIVKFRSTIEKSNCGGRAGTGLAFLALFGFGKEEEEPEPELISTIKLSILLIQRGEFKKAEQMLHVALRQAQTLQHYDGITYVYDVMANLALEVQDVEKAKKLFVSVMQRLMSQGATEDDLRILHISLKMAKLCEMSREPGKAETGYTFCVDHLKEHVRRTPDNEDAVLLYAMTLDWYGKMLLSQSRLSEALKCYQQSLKFCQQVYGDEHEQTVVLLNDLGTVHCLMGNYDEAIGFLSDALLIGKKLPEMTDLSSIHVNLGNVYLKKNLFNEAKEACSLGLKMAKQNNDVECQEQATSCLEEVRKLLKQ